MKQSFLKKYSLNTIDKNLIIKEKENLNIARINLITINC